MKKILLWVLLAFLCNTIQAATYYWVGGNGIWGTSASFANTSGGTGAVVSPASADIVIFDQNSGNPNVTVTGLTISIAQLQVTTSGAAVTVTFNGLASSFTMSGNLTVASNCIFNHAANIITVNNNVIGSGTCTGNGRIRMATSARTVDAGFTFSNLSISGTTFNGNVNINGDLLHNGTNTTNGNIVTVGGNLIAFNTTSTINTGAGKLVLSGANTVQSVGNITLSANTGSGYVIGDVINLSSPPTGGVQAQAVVTSVTGGAISGVGITDPGSGYTSAPTVTSITSSAGTGATLSNISTFLSTSSIKYVGGRTNAVIENLEINNNGNQIQIATARTLTLTSNISFSVSNTSGRLILAGASSNLTIGNNSSATVSMAATNALGTVVQNAGNIVVNSTATNVGTIYFDQSTFNTTNRISQFTLTAGTVTLGNALHVNSNFVLTAGTLTLGANAALLLNGTTFTRTSGVINASNTSSFFRLTSGSVTVPSGVFSPTTVANFVDSSNGTGTITHTLGSAITVTNLKLAISNTASFSMVNGSNLTIANGGSITMQRTNGTGTVSLGSVPTFAGTVDLIYTGSQVITTGNELPTLTSAINNLTINTTASGAGITLNANATVNGSLFLQSGTFTLTNTLTLANNSTIVRGQASSSVAGNLSAVPSFGTGVNITILGTGAIVAGNEMPTGGVYGTLTVNNTTSYTLPASTYSITLASLVVGTGGTAAIFQYGNTTSINTVTVNGNITIGDGASFICGAQSNTVVHILNVLGNISIGNNAIFNLTANSTPSTRYIQLSFNSTSATDQTISSSATPSLVTFGNIILNRSSVANKVVCSTSANTTPSGQIITYTNGTWEQTAGTLTFSTGSTQIIPTTGALILSGTGSLTQTGSLTVSGTLTVNTSGALNVGTGNNNIQITGSAAVANVTSGTINCNGRFQVTTNATLNINGGSIVIPTGTTVNTSSNSMFQVSSTTTFNFSSGSVIVRSPNLNTTLADIQISNNAGSITGGTFIVTNALITVNITPAVFNFTVENNGGSATARLMSSSLNVSNNLTVTSGLFDAATNNLNVTVGGQLLVDAGNLSMATGTLTLNGSAVTVNTGSISTTTTTNITFGGTNAGPLNIPASIVQVNNLVVGIASATMLNLQAGITVNGNLTLTSGILHDAGNTINCLGNITGTGGVHSSATGGKIRMVTGGTSFTAATYGNFEIDGGTAISPISASGSANFASGSKFTVTANGYFNGGLNTMQFGTNAPVGTVDIYGTATTTRGNGFYGSFNSLFGGSSSSGYTAASLSVNFYTGSTAIYNSTNSGQNISGITYHHLIITGTRSAISASNISWPNNALVNITGDLTINTTLVSNVSFANTNSLSTINFIGTGVQNIDFSNSAVTSGISNIIFTNFNFGATAQVNANVDIQLSGNILGSGSYTATTNKLILIGSGRTISSATISNLELNNAGGFSLTGSPNITGTLTLTNGALSIGSNTLSLNGNPISIGAGSLATTSSSSISFGGNNAGPLLLPASVVNLNNLTLNNSNTTPATLNVNSSLTIASNLAYTSGTINLGTNLLNSVGGSISGGGILLTTNTSSTPLPSGKSWSGTVEFAANTTQNIVAGTFNNLALSGAAIKLLNGTITLNGSLSTNNVNDILSIGNNDLMLNGTIAGSGFIRGGSNANITIGGTGALGTLSFDQSTDGTTNILNNIVVNRTSGTISLGNKLVVTNTYTPTSGTLTTNGYLHIRSTAINTARIAQGSISGGYIVGNVTVERYISASTNRAWRLLAPGVTTTTNIRANWQEGTNNTSTSINNNPTPGYGTHITGATGNTGGFDVTQTNQSSLYEFSHASQAWVTVNNTNVNTLNANKGYLLFVRGNRNNINTINTATGSSNTVLRATGSIVQGDQTLTGLEGNGRYSLVTNPFASPINWASIYTGSNITNFENYITIWDPNIGTRGGYVTVTNGGIVSGGVSNLNTSIQSGQAFFVIAKTGVVNPSFIVRESHKTTTNNLDVFRSQSSKSSLKIFLFTQDNPRRCVDGATAIFNNQFSTNIDEADAQQMDNWDEDVSLLSNGKLLSIESRPLVNSSDTLSLNIQRLKTITYSWCFVPNEIFNHNASLQAWLIDSFTGTQTLLSNTDTTFVNFTVTSNTVSAVASRFKIVFRNTTALSSNAYVLVGSNHRGNNHLQLNILQVNNISKIEWQRSVNAQDFVTIKSLAVNTSNSYSWIDDNLINNTYYYRVKIIKNTGEIKWSNLIQLSKQNTSSSYIKVIPNPVLGTHCSISWMQPKVGKYQLDITDITGKKVYSEAIHIGNTSTSVLLKNIQLTTITAGHYLITIVNDFGERYTSSFIKQ